VAEEIQASGALTYGEIAAKLGMDERQLHRIRKEVEEADGDVPEPGDRRPQRTGEIPEDIQKLIRDIRESGDRRHPYTAADVTRILNKNYKEVLKKYHGAETISETTVRKYLDRLDKEKEETAKARAKDDREHPRGNFEYPEPFQQVAIDTSYFKLFGLKFYIITVFELGGRLNLFTMVFLEENTAAVVSMLEEVLGKYPQVEATVIDRGTPYLNKEVHALLLQNDVARVVAPVATPTAKAAAERHFLTLKTALRAAVEKVLPEHPGWSPQALVKILEMGVAVFQGLYHQIPQEHIDGLSPAERISAFDPVRAAAAMVGIFERAVNSEPSEEYAREIHRRFQLPCTEEETVKALASFGTPTLRRLVEKVKPFLGPPLPDYIYDALGFLQAEASNILRERREAYYHERYDEECKKQRPAQQAHRREELERERREIQERPERFVENTLGLLVRCLEKNFAAGVRYATEELRALMTGVAKKLGAAFSNEVERLKRRVEHFTSSPEVRAKAKRVLDDFAGRDSGEMAGTETT
jgi:hypothetical protein